MTPPTTRPLSRARVLEPYTVPEQDADLWGCGVVLTDDRPAHPDLCPRCGRSFPADKGRKWCSPHCSRLAASARFRERNPGRRYHRWKIDYSAARTYRCAACALVRVVGGDGWRDLFLVNGSRVWDAPDCTNGRLSPRLPRRPT